MRCDNILLLNYLVDKLNHDLTNMLTGIYQSTDLIQTDNELIRDQSFKLLSSTTDRMTNTLKIFKQMYSSYNDDSEYYLQEINDLLANCLSFNEIEVECNNNEQKIVLGKLGQLITCLVFMLSSMLFKKSKIIFSLDANDNIIIHSNAKAGLNKNYYNNIVKIFSTDDEPELNYYNVHSYYTKYLAHLLKTKIFIKREQDDLTIMTAKYE